MSTAQNYFEDARNPNLPWVTETHLTGSDSMAVAHIENCPPGHYPDPPVDKYMLQLLTKGIGSAKVDFGAGQFQIDRFGPGCFGIGAPGQRCDYQVEFSFSLYAICLPTAIVDRAGLELYGKSAPPIERLYKEFGRDVLLRQLISEIMSEAMSGGPNGALYTDYLANATAARLFALERAERPVSRQIAPLGDAEASLVLQAMEDQVEQRVKLDDLCALVDMDVYRFSRAFRARFGETPYRFMLLRRVKRAEALLQDSDMSIAEVAFACGFSSQAHLTATFAKFSNTTPGAIRRARMQ
ncbi:MAG: AraC family transcriptional regulator [Pseudomonadota bacterium]